MIKITKAKIYDKAPRIITFVTNKGAKLSMQRALTSTEYNYAQDLVDSKRPDINFQHEFFEGRKMFNKLKIKKILSQHGEFKKEVKALRPLALHNEEKYKIFRPIVPAEERYDFNEKKAMIEAGIFSLYDGLIVPDSPLVPNNEFSNHISKLLDFVDDDAPIKDKSNFDLIPQITIENDPNDFKSKLKSILDLGINRLNILNDSLETYYPNYSYLRDFSKKHDNIIIIGSQVKRAYKYGKIRVSPINILPLYGQDILIPSFTKPFIKKEGQRNPLDRPKREALFYDRLTNGILSRGEYNLLHGEKLKFTNNPFTNGETLTSFFNKYTKEEILRIAKVMESLDSYEEIKNEREKIIEDEKEYLKYISNKAPMQPIIRRLNLLQTRLIF